MTDYLRRVHADYIVADKGRPDDRRFLIPVLAAAPLRFATVYENGQFILMRVLEGRDGNEGRQGGVRRSFGAGRTGRG
jgi:hypothetical protein